MKSTRTRTNKGTRTNKEMRDYYKKNKEHYRKGGKYYYYRPKHDPPFLVTINRGEFIITFD
tara:strand:+ start:314 stop:496 length:183 start_codon:yes stop_codon:yes gene_type:complete